MYHTVLYSNVLYCIVQQCIILYSTVLYCIVQYCTVWYSIVLYTKLTEQFPSLTIPVSGEVHMSEELT